MNTPDKYKDLILDLEKVINRFIIDEEKGMTNGYNTWVEGTLALNYTGGLEISINNDDLSKNRLRLLAQILEEQLKEVLLKYKNKDEHGWFIVNITRQHDEHGAFTTYINVSEGKSINWHRHETNN